MTMTMRNPTPLLLLLSMLYSPGHAARPVALYDRLAKFRDHDDRYLTYMEEYFDRAYVTDQRVFLEKDPFQQTEKVPAAPKEGERRAETVGDNTNAIVDNSAVANSHYYNNYETQEEFLKRFQYTAYGYCDLNPEQVGNVYRLVNTNELYVTNFLDISFYDNNTIKSEKARSTVSEFVSLARDVIPPQVRYNYTDREILQGVMKQNDIVIDPRIFTADCLNKVEVAVDVTLNLFAKLMGIGMDPDVMEKYKKGKKKGKKYHSLTSHETNVIQGNIYWYLLAPLENPFLTLAEKFAQLIFAYFDVYQVKYLLDSVWPVLVNSWFEHSVTGISLITKYAGSRVAGGGALLPLFNAFQGTEKDDIIFAYNDAVRTCNNPPTVSPTSAPTYSDTGFNKEIPLIAVYEATSVSLEVMDARWTAFRSKWPDRYVCLLQPVTRGTKADAGLLKIPASFFSDPQNKTKFSQVIRDNGDWKFSNWYDVCNLYPFVELKPSMPEVAGMIQDRFSVRESIKMFEKQLSLNNMEYNGVIPTTDWITGFDRDFIP